MQIRFAAALALVVAAAIFPGTAEAHEIGTTRVSVLLHDNQSYEIDIVADAASLVEKLESVEGRPLTEGADAPKLEAILRGSEATFRKRVKLLFGGTEARPEIAYTVAPPKDAASAYAATIRLTGAIPEGARDFTWKYSWTFTTYSIAVRMDPSAAPATEWLEGGQTSRPFPIAAQQPESRLSIAWRHLVLGFTHIVPLGLDHMLFVLGIFLLSPGWRSLLWQVSAFTVAHSITLGLGMYGLISAPPAIVEPLIAVSIAYVAIENIFLSELRPWRIGLVFAFGLLHGMGFAGVLQELGLPRSQFVTALVTFNLGVEAGQLAVIGSAFLLVGWRLSNRSWYRARVVVPASVMIACVAVYWTVERLAA